MLPPADVGQCPLTAIRQSKEIRRRSSEPVYMGSNRCSTRRSRHRVDAMEGLQLATTTVIRLLSSTSSSVRAQALGLWYRDTQQPPTPQSPSAASLYLLLSLKCPHIRLVVCLFHSLRAAIASTTRSLSPTAHTRHQHTGLIDPPGVSLADPCPKREERHDLIINTKAATRTKRTAFQHQLVPRAPNQSVSHLGGLESHINATRR